MKMIDQSVYLETVWRAPEEGSLVRDKILDRIYRVVSSWDKSPIIFLEACNGRISEQSQKVVQEFERDLGEDAEEQFEADYALSLLARLP